MIINRKSMDLLRVRRGATDQSDEIKNIEHNISAE
jgi:hypothetical protein